MAVTPLSVLADQTIAPDNSLIEAGGLCFASSTPTQLSLDRFSPAVLASPGGTFNPDNARTPACVTLRFCTNSSFVRDTFIETPGLNRGDDFSIYQNGAKTAQMLGLNLLINSVSPGQPVTFEIVCPSVTAVAFTGLQIEDSAVLYPVVPINRYRYAAFGDSITHGIGQDAWSDLSYPWLLADSRNWQAFNFAISGSFAVPSIGAMIDNEPFDIATVLWGQNDWNFQNDLPHFKSQMELFVANFRAHHPTTDLYLITLIASTRTTPTPNNGYTREHYRQAVRDIVTTRTAAGDAKIFVLEGLSLTTLSDLGDGVHLTPTGAANMAAALASAITVHSALSDRSDFDHDGDVDQTDFAHFQLCLSGTGKPQHIEECRNARLDGDSDADLNDLALLLSCLAGSDQPPACP